MRVPRVWIAAATTGASFDLDAGEAHHVVRVLRRAPGDAVEVVSAAGELFAGAIESVVEEPHGDASGPRVRVRVGESRGGSASALVPWTVAVAPVKEKSFDLAVRFASELGLERLVPLVAERSQVRIERGGEPGARPERWERIAREAAKQCGRAPALEIAAAANIDEVIVAARSAGAPAWIASPGGAAPVPDELVGPGGQPRRAVFLVGPEGGFSAAELARALAAGARRLGFPTPVLRTPTAVVLVAALGVWARWSKP